MYAKHLMGLCNTKVPKYIPLFAEQNHCHMHVTKICTYFESLDLFSKNTELREPPEVGL